MGAGRVAWLASMVLLTACSDGEDDVATPDPGAGSDELVLRTTPVTLAPGEERYFCWSVPVGSDGDFPLAGVDFEIPGSVHHYQLEVQTSPPAEQPWECGFGEGGQGGPPGEGGPGGDDDGGGPPAGMGGLRILAVGGPGTSPQVRFPEGTAMMLEPTAHVVMQLHLLNASGEPYEFPTASARMLPSEADPAGLSPVGVLLVNDSGIQLPPNTDDIAAGVDCVLPSALENVFGVWPHMHLLGDHIEVALGGGPVIATDWNFEEQKIYETSASLAAGESIRVSCVFDNTTSETVTFGMSTNDEMCTAFVYYWPAVPDLAICE